MGPPKKEKEKGGFVISFVRKDTSTLLNYPNVQSLLKFKIGSIPTIMQRSTQGLNDHSTLATSYDHASDLLSLVSILMC